MIELSAVSIAAGTFQLANISLAVPNGEYAVLMGKSGSGKTTIMEAICGLRMVSAGKIILSGQDMTYTPPAKRNIGFVPQDGVLFPHISVRENISLPLKIRNWPVERVTERVDELAALLDILPILHRSPGALSGGERQRVALARALVFYPQILCLDEPLSALDDEARERLCDLLMLIHRQWKITVLHVTHNPKEANSLATCLLTLIPAADNCEKRSFCMMQVCPI